MKKTDCVLRQVKAMPPSRHTIKFPAAGLVRQLESASEFRVLALASAVQLNSRAPSKGVLGRLLSLPLEGLSHAPITMRAHRH
jgi:hypothetical protein